MTRRRVILSLAALVVAAQMLPKHRDNPAVDHEATLVAVARPPAEIQEIVERACYDCHSHETRWPWYSSVTPIGQWLVHHVEEARRSLSLSGWASLSDYRRAKLMKEMAEEVEHGDMPLRSYLWLHPGARLSAEERQLFVDWCNERLEELEAEAD